VKAAKDALAIDSSTPDALLVLGMIACHQREFDKALDFANRAAAGGGGEDWVNAVRGRALLAMNRYAEARRAARKASSAPIGDPVVAHTIGVLLTHAGLHTEAPAYFERALAAAPGRPAFLSSLAISLRFNGDLEGSRRRFRELLEIDPGNAAARLALVQLDKQTPDNNILEELEALMTRPGLRPEESIVIGHAIAKTYEDLGRWDTAFDALESGKAPMAARSQFNQERQTAIFEAAGTAIPVHSRPGGDESDAPIFVLGMPRSGTTLVERILGSHSQVKSAGELPDFGPALRAVAGVRSNRALDPVTLAASQHVDLAALGRTYLESAREIVPEAPRLIDKMPFNFFYVPAILAALPRAHVICLRRDPADTLLSNMRQHFSGELSYYNYVYKLDDTAMMVAGFNRLADRYREELPADRYREIAYEDVVSDQETATRDLLDFCGLPFEDACLTPERNTQPVATASAAQVRQPVYKTSVARWKRYEKAGPRIVAALENNGLKIEA
jgi:tetratricopeptide (TPR) repeat protein